MIPPSRVCVLSGLLVNCAICALPRQATISTSLASPRLNFINFGEVLLAAQSEFVMTQSEAETSQSGKVARSRLERTLRKIEKDDADGCIRAVKL